MFVRHLRNDIYESYNESQETDVKSFLNVTEGQEPDALNLFKSEYVKTETNGMKNVENISKNILSRLTKILNDVEKGAENKEGNDSMLLMFKNLVIDVLNMLISTTSSFSEMTQNLYLEKVNIYRDLHRAISLGLSSPKN